MSKDDSNLERAREHCFLAGIGDVGEQLCAANMPYGIAKIQHVQRELGVPADATFVGAPDATVTRNVARWNQGFGYGGRIQWSGDFAVLDIKSNGCGVLVGTLPEIPSREELDVRAKKLVQEGMELEGIHVEYDLHEGNHFLDLVETKRGLGGEEPEAPAYFVMHSSGHEHRSESPFGVGIYYDKSEELMQRARIFETPWGKLHTMTGDDAAWFYDSYMAVQNWNERRREAIASALFDDWKVVENATHQGMTAMNACHLGCYVFDDEDIARGARFPLTISADDPIFMVRPKKNFSEEIANRVGFMERATKHGVVDRVVGANLLPHGGGYRYPDVERVQGVLEDGPDQRRFQLLKKDGEVEIIENPRSRAFGYRGLEVLTKLEELELGELTYEGDVRYVVRD
ncbi:MAG: hypothetical protein DRJ42_22125 [Deltaproteobacteria bacterium]|nr:MAG: hypothetical protein DRJ42_22125 [Deltaproteobacteria bacterium]